MNFKAKVILFTLLFSVLPLKQVLTEEQHALQAKNFYKRMKILNQLKSYDATKFDPSKKFIMIQGIIQQASSAKLYVVIVKPAKNTWHKVWVDASTEDNTQVILKDGSIMVPGTDTRLMPDGLVKTWQWAFTGDDAYMKGKDYPEMKMSLVGPNGDGFFNIKCDESDGGQTSYLGVDFSGFNGNRVFFGTKDVFSKGLYSSYYYRLLNVGEQNDFDPSKPFIAYLDVDGYHYILDPHFQITGKFPQIAKFQQLGSNGYETYLINPEIYLKNGKLYGSLKSSSMEFELTAKSKVESTWSWVASIKTSEESDVEGGTISIKKSDTHDGYYYILCDQGSSHSYMGMDGGGRGGDQAFFGTMSYMNSDDYTWQYYNFRLMNV